MNRQLKIIFIILLALVIVGTAFTAVLWFINRDALTNTNTNVNADSASLPEGETIDNTNVNSNTNTQSNVNTGTILPDDTTDDDESSGGGVESAGDAEEIEALGLSFAERFGSFSNQSDFANVLNLKSFMTSSMQGWADTYVEVGRTYAGDTSVYYGITTKAVSVEQVSLDLSSGSAEYLVYTQRREVNDANDTERSFQQKLHLQFEEVDSVWKVDQATWLAE